MAAAAGGDVGGSGSIGGDFSPSGLRVLAVDDDVICLKVLERLLRQCHYQVTVTSQALQALKMLRERKNEFDLVISDVNMPDMDGFKLLEHVEFEMDIPVIMVSAHSDNELVYKGVTHGAVDYLLKPVRIEELKNIWQHVVRKKKMSSKNKTNSSSQDNAANNQDNTGAPSSGSSDPNARSNRKRKDQDDEGEGDDEGDGDSDENGREGNEDSGAQKKARVVWTVELHKKFVQAVNQLGYDKAVPKKILDTMDVEGLTRENVASHLQKYRLYLKRMSSDRNMGGMSSIDEFRYLTGSGRFPSAYQQPGSGILGRLSSSTSGILQRGGISSSGIPQPVNPQQHLLMQQQQQQQQSSIFSSNHSSSPFQILSPKLSAQIISFSTGLGNSPGFGTLPPSSGIGVATTTTPQNPLMLHQNHRTSFGIGGQPSVMRVPPLNQAPFGQVGPSNLLENNDPVQLPKFPPSSFPSHVDYSSGGSLLGNVVEGYNNPASLNTTNDSFVSAINPSTVSSFDVGSSSTGVGGVPPAAAAIATTTPYNGYESLDDMMNAMIKREQNEGLLIDGEFGLDDAFQMGSSPCL